MCSMNLHKMVWWKLSLTESKDAAENQRKIAGGERSFREAISDLPIVGSSEVEDKAYSAVCAFEVQQLTYSFSCYDTCKERCLECKGF